MPQHEVYPKFVPNGPTANRQYTAPQPAQNRGVRNMANGFGVSQGGGGSEGKYIQRTGERSPRILLTQQDQLHLGLGSDLPEQPILPH